MIIANESIIYRTVPDQLLYPIKLQKEPEFQLGEYAQKLELSQWVLHKEIDSPILLKHGFL